MTAGAIAWWAPGRQAHFEAAGDGMAGSRKAPVWFCRFTITRITVAGTAIEHRWGYTSPGAP